MSISNEDKPLVSRRNFIQKAAIGAGAAAAALSASKAKAVALAADASAMDAAHPIRVPAEILNANSSAVTELKFPMTGSDVFLKACKDEGVAAMFCCPGNYPMIQGAAQIGIPTYGGRDEGAMTSAADGYTRVTGEITMCSGTEGPGFTSMICAIAQAYSAKTPLLVVASNTQMNWEDAVHGIQCGYQQPTTEGIKKYGKRMINPKRVHEYAGYAFRQLRNGVPGPVHIDFPSEIAEAKFKDASELTYYYDKTKYRTETVPYPSPQAIKAAVALIQTAQRPIIVSSNGVFYRKAWDALKIVAEKGQIPVVESGAMKGQFSDAHPLCANAAPDALASADLVILVGQHQMPNIGEFAFGPNVKYIRMDTNAEDMGRNLPIDVAIVSDEKVGLEALAEALPKLKHDTWVAEVAAARKKFEDENDSYAQMGMKYTDAVHPGVIAKGISDFLYKGKIPKEQTVVSNGGYGIARYVRRVVRGYRPGQVLNCAYQYAAVGPDIAYGFGAGAAVQNGAGVQAAYRGHTVLCVTGDAGFGYSAMEIDTIAKYRVPMVLVVYNNNAWGTWTGAQAQPRSAGIHLFQENLRYDKVCEALGGGQSEYVTKPEDFAPALARAYDTATKGSVPVVVNAQGKKEFWLKDKFPPGNLGKVEPGCMSYYH